jgi:hypothetical protein
LRCELQPQEASLDAEVDAGLCIAANATLKQARELDQAGLAHGALLRYLEAVLRAAPLTSAVARLDAEAAARRAAEVAPSLAGADHSLARLFVELALGEAEEPGADGSGAVEAAAVFDAVLPRYFAALGPAPVRPSRPDAAVTVTLVRWPYT